MQRGLSDSAHSAIAYSPRDCWFVLGTALCCKALRGVS
jgi:hypothetical protein